VNVTCHLVNGRPADDAIDVPIGRAIDGAEVEVVDGSEVPCPDDVEGELVVRGRCVARASAQLPYR